MRSQPRVPLPTAFVTGLSLATVSAALVPAALVPAALVPAALVVAALGLGCSTSRSIDAGLDGELVRGPDLDPRGRFENCWQTWVFEEGGVATHSQYLPACTVTGRWSTEGDRLTVTWDRADCGADPSTPFLASGLRSPGGLLLIPDGSRAESYAEAGATIQTFLLTDDAEPTRRTVARLVGRPSEPWGSGCYRSEDGMCGGLFSCSGRILEWTEDAAGEIVASTSCTGGCPCGAILHLAPSPDGSLAVTYDGVNCDGAFSGSARAEALP